MIERTQLKITTITPVAIGAGIELSPYSDYIIDNNQVCFIDKAKLQKIIASNNRWLDLYVQGVAMQMDNNRSNFDIKSFLFNNNIVEELDEIILSRCQFQTDMPQSKLSIKGIIKTPLLKPYFPGTTIKGAFKTIMMYNWLITNENAERMIEDVIAGGNFNALEKKFECKVDEYTNNLIQPNTIQLVTDSKPLARNSNVVVDCYRKMPIRLECIAKNKSTEFEIALENYKWEELAEQAYNYTSAVLEREFALVEDDNKLTKYYNYLADLEEMMNETDSNTTYLRLGAGKGYYLNSLGIAIYDYITQEGKEALYAKYESFMKNEYAKKGKLDNFSLEEFPRSRLMVKTTQEPLGWVKIEKM